MTVLDETYELANGVRIPKLGLGTWFIDDGDAAEAVREAVTVGYRNIETAQAYGNERGVMGVSAPAGSPARSCSCRPSSPPRSRTTRVHVP